MNHKKKAANKVEQSRLSVSIACLCDAIPSVIGVRVA